MRAFAKRAEQVITALAVFFFVGLSFLPALQIVLRQIGSPFVGAEELTRFFLICMVFLSYPLVVGNRENITMDEFRHMLPAKLREGVETAIDYSAAVLTLFMAYAAWGTLLMNRKSFTPTLEIPFWIFMACTVIAFFCVGIIHSANLYTKYFSKP